MADHGVKIATKFLEDDVICRYGVPKFVLTNNGREWAIEFDVMCKDYGIQHQHIAPRRPQCNGMANYLIKTIKHGITVLFATPKNVNYWDEQLVKVMFRYSCRIQANTMFSPFMIMIGHAPRLKADNYLHSLTIVVDDNVDVETIIAQFLQKVKLIQASMKMSCSMWSKHKRNRRRPMLPEKVNKLLKVWLLKRQWSR